MRLEHIAIALRRRNGWEALDLGQVMLRAWGGSAYRAWLASYWLFGVTLLLVLWAWQDVATMLLWWLKPLFDRVLLFVYSRALFGADTGVREVWRALPGILRRSGLLAGLTWHRFSLMRSFVLPVWQLEGQRGRQGRARRRVLAARSRGYGVWLTFVCVHVAAFIGISLVLLAEVMAPLGTEGLFSWEDWVSDELEPWRLFILNLLFMAAESVVEPLYVASGFSLYLNRRSELEGWDIELAFRQLNERKAERARPAAGVAALLLAGVLAVGGVPEARAQEVAPDEAGIATVHGPDSPARAAIRAVLADPVFGTEKEALRWRMREQKTERREPPGWLKPFLDFVEAMSTGLRAVAWIAVGIVAALFLYLLYRHRGAWLPGRSPRPAPPEFLFGLDVRPGSLPADVVAAARAARARGDAAAALSLLYRGALVALIHRAQVEFRAGDTEDDCEHRVAGRIDAAAAGYFAELLAAWRLTAYAHRPPGEPRLEALCAAWPRHFGLETP